MGRNTCMSTSNVQTSCQIASPSCRITPNTRDLSSAVMYPRWKASCNKQEQVTTSPQQHACNKRAYTSPCNCRSGSTHYQQTRLKKGPVQFAHMWRRQIIMQKQKHTCVVRAMSILTASPCSNKASSPCRAAISISGEKAWP